MSSFPRVRRLFPHALMFLGLWSGLIAAQTAAAQTDPPQLVITQVDVDYANQKLYIHGSNFGTTNSVSIANFGLQVEQSTGASIVAKIHPAFLTAGSYLLKVSAGTSAAQNDTFALTVGAQGPQGPKGDVGPQGLSSLTRTTSEAAGTNCATGGAKLETGVDANRDGALDNSEVNAALTRYVCNGARGPQGEPGVFNGSFGGTSTFNGPAVFNGGVYGARLVCQTVVGAETTSRSFSTGSTATCPAGWGLTGGACRHSAGTVVGTGSLMTTQSYTCVLTGPTSGAGSVHAQGQCCVIQ
ncbi:DUF7151 family protein [Myxococcus stipitatus]|uniref:DUF7151 family protein n=1 Tax=Myxococcus stipitatus TaxID=83455 RepID=UPI0030D230E4